MSKTVFIDGTPVTPAFLNAFSNPTFSENPTEDGEISFNPISIPGSSFTKEANVSLGESFKIERYPDNTLRVSGKIHTLFSVTPGGASLAWIAGNPLKIVVIPGETSIVFLGLGNQETSLFLSYDAVNDKTTLSLVGVSGENLSLATCLIALNYHYFAD